jgi:hypothetical protein
MARPRRDGRPSRPITKHKLSDAYVRNLRPAEDHWYLTWDSKISGLAIAVHPTGKKTWKVVYQFNRKPRWLTIGPFDIVDVDKARRLAGEILLKVVTGIDAQAERQASRGASTFEEAHRRYVTEYAQKQNKSWKQADTLVRSNVLPKWAKLQAADICRSDVKLLLSQISSASVATQTKRAISAVFSWCIEEEIGGVKVNPCQRIDTEVSQSRERVLSDAEVPRFWSAFDGAGYLQGMALKLILLTGQRPGEVLHMHRQHIEDGGGPFPVNRSPS